MPLFGIRAVVPNYLKKLVAKIQSKENEVFFSQISLLEIAVKQKIGKLPDLKLSINQIYEQAIDDGFVFWEIKNKHIAIYYKVPLFEQHRDPFDRLLIATGYEEKFDIITIDNNFLLYPDLIKVVW